MSTLNFDSAPKDAIKYFRSKGVVISENDLLKNEYDMAFTIAKLADIDLLYQIRNSLDTALSSGQSFGEWKKNITSEIESSGWIKQNPKSNLFTPWRLETIFRTNMQTAYAAGQWQKIVSNGDSAPYLLYSAIDDHRTRPQHRAWDGTILPYDNPWWKTHFPPNGYNCRCSVIQLSSSDLKQMGLKVNKKPPKESFFNFTNPDGKIEKIDKGIDPGFNRNPGENYLKNIFDNKISQLPTDMKKSLKGFIGSVLGTMGLIDILSESSESNQS